MGNWGKGQNGEIDTDVVVETNDNIPQFPDGIIIHSRWIEIYFGLTPSWVHSIYVHWLI